MSTLGIVMIIIGAAVFLLGFLLSGKRGQDDTEATLISEAEIKKLIDKEVDQVEERVGAIVDETIEYAMEKTERSMEKLSNESIMTISEYSDTVLAEINNNHKEVVFLYDMLNDKHDNLLAVINEITVKTDEIKQTVKDAEITANEAAEKVDEALEIAENAIVKLKDAQFAANEAQEAIEDAFATVMQALNNSDGEVMNVHSGGVYHEEIVEEVQRELDDREQPVYGRKEAEESNAGNRMAVQSESLLRVAENTAESGVNTAEISERDRLDRMLRAFENPTVYDELSKDVAIQEDAVQEALLQDTVHPETENYVNIGDSMAMSKTAMAAIGLSGETQLGDGETKPAFDEESEVEFKPIKPRRVEIIHEPDGDYIANEEDLPTSVAFANMGFFTKEEPKKKAATEHGFGRGNREDFGSLDIQFTKKKEKGRNSNERILELHKAGKSNMAIAKELGLGLGEVKLVIDLFEGM